VSVVSMASRRAISYPKIPGASEGCKAENGWAKRQEGAVVQEADPQATDRPLQHALR
jgi:hypothetical protein